MSERRGERVAAFASTITVGWMQRKYEKGFGEREKKQRRREGGNHTECHGKNGRVGVCYNTERSWSLTKAIPSVKNLKQKGSNIEGGEEGCLLKKGGDDKVKSWASPYI